MNETRPPSLPACCLAESFGTFLLVLIGCGVVHAAVLTSAQQGLWQVAVVWGAAVTLAIFAVGGISGAHINPAITIALAFWKQFPWPRVVPYIFGQLSGAIAAAVVLYGLFHPYLADLEARKHVVRGEPGSEISAMCYGEYFANPGPLTGGTEAYSVDAHAALNRLVTEPIAFAAEFVGTMILAALVFALTDQRNAGAPPARLAPVFIGLTIAGLISIIAPLTQACFNPARDFGPRLVAYFAGWEKIAIPGPRGYGFLTVYILAPTLGALVGGGVHHLFLRHYYSGQTDRSAA
jgi:glycerol uptake facilitator protein